MAGLRLPRQGSVLSDSCLLCRGTHSPARATGAGVGHLRWVSPNIGPGAAGDWGLFSDGWRLPRRWDPEVTSPLGSH